MKLSARNVLGGRVVEVVRGATTAHVKIDIGGGVITSSFTNEAVDELKLVKGDMAYAVIKASDVMVAKEVRRPGTAHTPADEVTGRRGSPSGLTAS